ncbi:MAG: hypothetical protein ACI4TX_04300 [Christensenellales bacterium]
MVLKSMKKDKSKQNDRQVRLRREFYYEGNEKKVRIVKSELGSGRVIEDKSAVDKLKLGAKDISESVGETARNVGNKAIAVFHNIQNKASNINFEGVGAKANAVLKNVNEKVRVIYENAKLNIANLKNVKLNISNLKNVKINVSNFRNARVNVSNFKNATNKIGKSFAGVYSTVVHSNKKVNKNSYDEIIEDAFSKGKDLKNKAKNKLNLMRHKKEHKKISEDEIYLKELKKKVSITKACALVVAGLGYLSTTSNVSFDIASYNPMQIILDNIYWAIDGAVKEPLISVMFLLPTLALFHKSTQLEVERNAYRIKIKEDKKKKHINVNEK